MQENHGPAAARNAGFESSDSEFLLMVDADDRLHSITPAAEGAGLDAGTARWAFDHRQAATAPIATTTADTSSAQAPASPQVLSDVLGQEAAHAQSSSGGLLGAILDRDGDGHLDLGDLLKAGGSVLGGLGQPGQRL